MKLLASGLQNEEINRLLYISVGLNEIAEEAKQLYAQLKEASGNAAFIGNFMRRHEEFSGEYRLPLECLK